MQTEITKPGKVLDEAGRPQFPGYSKRPVLTYDRKNVKAPKWRIKEWDYYAVLSPKFGCSMTIADLSYSAMVTVVVFDFESRQLWRKTKLLWLTFGKMGLPSSSDKGDVAYESDGWLLSFKRFEDRRELVARIRQFRGEDTLDASFVIEDKKDESMTILTPWANHPKAFYYNQKINCMPVQGTLALGTQTVAFGETDTFAVLDWGRGVWTYKNTWYWGSLSGVVDGKRFGFNIGYGFGDTSAASENMLFYDGIAHKLDQVRFELDPSDFMKPWRFTSNDGRFEMTMTPILDRQDDLNFLVIKNLGHQVFGTFDGTATLDDGTVLTIRGLLGFAEQITNHY
jgi:hypothetical protein